MSLYSPAGFHLLFLNSFVTPYTYGIISVYDTKLERVEKEFTSTNEGFLDKLRISSSSKFVLKRMDWALYTCERR
jgi:hypothetical protein